MKTYIKIKGNHSFSFCEYKGRYVFELFLVKNKL
jgi:hypothetical protein